MTPPYIGAKMTALVILNRRWQVEVSSVRRLIQTRVFTVSVGLSTRMPGLYTKLNHERLLLDPFQFFTAFSSCHSSLLLKKQYANKNFKLSNITLCDTIFSYTKST
jgi:hypothetical protein